MRAKRGTDTVNGIFVRRKIGFKRGIDRFFQSLETTGDRNHFCSENFHAGYVRRLLGDVDESHVNFAFESEIRGGGCQRHAMLSGSGFGDQFFLAEKLCQQSFAHAVIEFMSSRMVQVFPFQIDLAVAEVTGETVAVIHRSGASLKFAADPPELVDELRRVANRLISVRDFAERGFQFGRDMTAAVLSETSVLVGIIPEIA